MFRRPLMLAATLTAGASLLLTGCGGSTQDPKPSGEITGAGGGEKKPSPSTTGEPSGGTRSEGRPVLKTDKNFKEEFENWSSKDQKTNAVLLDGKLQALATNSAIFTSDPDAPEVAFYNDGPALRSVHEWVGQFKNKGHTLTGYLRYYKPRVKFLAENYVSLSYCTDETKAFSKEMKSGKVHTTEASAKSYVLYILGMKKGANGVWKTDAMSGERGRCTA